MVRRGIARGELAPDAPVTLLLDTLAGGAMMHVLSTPPDLKANLDRDVRGHAERLVSFLLSAADGQRDAPRADPGALSR
jgi:hypothetical protein